MMNSAKVIEQDSAKTLVAEQVSAKILEQDSEKVVDQVPIAKEDCSCHENPEETFEFIEEEELQTEQEEQEDKEKHIKLLTEVENAEREIDRLRKLLTEPGVNFQETVGRLECAINMERYAREVFKKFDREYILRRGHKESVKRKRALAAAGHEFYGNVYTRCDDKTNCA
jgi:hypothetical protein